MVKTRSTRSNSGEDSTAESEVNTEYSEDFDESDVDSCKLAEATVIKKPTKSQSTPVMSTNYRIQGNSPRHPAIVHVDASPIQHVGEGPKRKQTEDSGLLDGITAIMRNIMTDNMQAMRCMTENMQAMTNTIVSSLQSSSNQSIRKSQKKSHRGRSSHPPSRRPKRSRPLDPSPPPDDSFSESDSSQSSSEEYDDIHEAMPKGKQQISNRLPIFTGKEKWKVWFNRFEAVADLYNWTNKEKLAELLPRLQGIAGDFVYDQLSTEVTRSYTKLVKELGNRFGEVDTTKIYISKFNNRKKLNEGIHTRFCSRIEEII